MTRWIEDLCDAVSVDAPDRYRWLGQTFVVAGTQSSISGTRPELISAVASCLYANFYCTGVPSPPETRCLDGPLPSARFRADLESAISEDRTLEPGWTVTSRQNDQLRVSRGGVTFRCLPKNVAVDEGVQVQLGDVVSIWAPSVRSGISPGFLSVLGPVSPRLGEPLRRYYWNVAPEGAPRVLNAICRALNSLGVAYMLKALATPEDYSRRCDSVILYVPAAQRDTVEPALLPVLRAVADWVEPLTPAMTEILAPGLATADDPGNGESFGEVRCRALAECIVEAWTDAAFSRPPDGVVDDLLAAHGINIDSEQASPAPRLPEIRGWWTRPDVSHIEAATDLAARISRSAIWWEGRCNWVAPDVDLDPNGHPVLRYVALGPHLYAGTSGIALSLAAAWWATGVDDFRRTAIGAARQTLAMLADVRSKECLLDGGIGTALALGWVARTLGDDNMLAAAQQLLDCATLAPHPVPDLVGGEAGATLGLLACAAVFGEGVNLERAAECGARLAARVSTLFGDITAQRPDDALTGLSHGASGMAVALAEIDNARPDRSLTRAQEHTLRFERHHFSPIDGNWPDFRHPEVNGIKHYGSAWCHGAPGIALARLRLRQFGATNADLEVEARTALGATAEFTSRALHSGRYNTSLCHGLAGNAEILWQGRDLDLSHGSLACEVAAEVARRFTGRQIGWPCPMPGGEHPGLMVGLAGTALFYLRLHAPSLPSLLLLRPDEWLATSTA